MAILKKKEIKGMNLAELESRLKDLKLELLKANAQKASKTAANAKIYEIKKTIARMLTELNQRNFSEKFQSKAPLAKVQAKLKKTEIRKKIRKEKK